MFARHVGVTSFALVQMPSFETPGDGGSGGGGGGGDWPEYEVPGGVGDDPPAAAQPGAGGQPAGAPARSDAQPGQPGARPAAGQPAAGAQPGAQPGGQPGARRADLPEYRSRAIAERERLAEAERLDKLVQDGIKSTLLKAFGIGGDGQPSEDPKAARIREQIFGVIPGLKELVEKQKELLGVAASGAQWADTNKTYWQGVAARSLNSVHDGVAKLLLGEGKSAKDLDEEARDEIRDTFIRWVERDTTGARVQRYEAQDQSLVNEYLRAFGARYLDPVRRSAAVNVAARGEARNRQPVQGPAGAAPAAQPPQVDNNDEDAVHGRGWAVVQQLRNAS